MPEITPNPQNLHQPKSAEEASGKAHTSSSVIPRIIIAGVLTAIIAIVVVFLFRDSSPESVPTTAASSSSPVPAVNDAVVRENSHYLDEVPSSDVTFVEFLDFECEACGALYPVVEDIRNNYEGEVNFVIRYFPLDGHPNSRQAAHAVEAAARQDALEPMYKKMFETQEDWSHNEEPQDEMFREYAEELGLDVDQWEEAYFSDEVAERVDADFQDATALGLTGTPSFFVNGQQLTPESLNDLTDPIDEALENE